MARPLRIEFPGAIWHITSRGNERRDIVRDDDDRLRFVRLLRRVVDDRGWRLHAWVLMSNHYHLLLETPEMALSRGMHWLNQQYARTFNDRHGRVGHLFQGRFKSILVEREGHLLELVRYIVLNPVRAGMVRLAGDYRWSNYRATAGLVPDPAWLEAGWTLGQFHPFNRAAAREEYRRFVTEASAARYKPWEAIIGQVYLGSQEFRARIQELVDDRPRSREHPRAQRRPATPPAELVAQLVANSFGVDRAALERKSYGHARKALAQLLFDEGGLSLPSIAAWMRVSVAAVSKLRSAGRRLCERDERYRRKISALRVELKLTFQT
ncbi:MAG TPA: transposase [Thermoanaerobaculia bacterium]|nr:transposase [Thermoanaerobaculia bacterium]